MTKDEQWLLEEKYGGGETPEYEADKKRLALGEPLAYVIGYQPFLGLKIFLDSHPLIPRPETEWWTERLLANAEVSPPLGGDSSTLRFLDLCAGSGAIGCAALKSLPYMEVFFGEVDPAHEATILKNIRENKNNLDASRAHICIGDLFEPFTGMKFDIIAANPPYIPAGRVLETSVADYEPAQALYAGEDGLALIRRIAASVRCHLTEKGEAWIEVDSAHAEAARELFAAEGLRAEILTDQYGKPRVIHIERRALTAT
jgi:release factor glutamine methyltransferase